MGHHVFRVGTGRGRVCGVSPIGLHVLVHFRAGLWLSRTASKCRWYTWIAHCGASSRPACSIVPWLSLQNSAAWKPRGSSRRSTTCWFGSSNEWRRWKATKAVLNLHLVIMAFVDRPAVLQVRTFHFECDEDVRQCPKSIDEKHLKKGASGWHLEITVLTSSKWSTSWKRSIHWIHCRTLHEYDSPLANVSFPKKIFRS